jgi:hypothetical protein
MLVIKKLSEGGTDDLTNMIEQASLAGCDLIECVWNESKKIARRTAAQVIGFKVPTGARIDESGAVSEWIDGTVKFYPDNNGVCWGYIFDTPENRKDLYYAFSNDWFSIVDAKVREQIKQEAEEAGISTKPADKFSIPIKKSRREVEADRHIKNLEKDREEMKHKLEALERELMETKGEKAVYFEKRLKGVKIQNRDEILEEKKNAD